MGIVFQFNIKEASQIAGLGFFKGVICDKPHGIFRHFNFDAFQR
jgi:protein tyrosine phosphatase (PTP) superfamily phosphohydrolase (DUF442 family)